MNYYSSGGAYFPVNNDKDRQLVITTLKAMNWIYDQRFPWTEATEAIPQLRKLLALSGGNKDVARLILDIGLMEYFYGGLDYYEDSEGLFIYNSENIEVDTLDHLLRGLLNLLDYNTTVTVEWANTHSRNIPWDHGGGSMVVSRYGSLWVETGFWASMVAEKLFGLDGLEQNMYHHRSDNGDRQCPNQECKSTETNVVGLLTENGFHYRTLECEVCETKWVDTYAPIATRILVQGKVQEGDA